MSSPPPFSLFPSHLACDEERVEAAKLLVEHGASIYIENKEEKTPLQLAKGGLVTLLRRIVEGWLIHCVSAGVAAINNSVCYENSPSAQSSLSSLVEYETVARTSVELYAASCSSAEAN